MELSSVDEKAGPTDCAQVGMMVVYSVVWMAVSKAIRSARSLVAWLG